VVNVYVWTKFVTGDTQERRWLRRNAARRKVERVRVPMRSLNILSVPNPSSRTMALGLTLPLTEMSIRKHFWR
jgi:hypothetical protein